MGGDCLNVGCVPSKCVIRASRVDRRRCATRRRFGVRVPPGAERRLRRRDGAHAPDPRAASAQHDSARRFRDELGVDVFLGERALHRPPTRSRSTASTLRFSSAVIATGARAVAPPIPGLAEAGFLTNETVFSLTERPRRLRGDRRRADRLRAGAGLRAPRQRRSSCCTTRRTCSTARTPTPPRSCSAPSCARASGWCSACTIAARRPARRATTGHRVHRAPAAARARSRSTRSWSAPAARRTSRASASSASASPTIAQRGVQVDDHLRTTNPRIFAAGDVCMAQKFTHAADFAARIVIQNALFFGRKQALARCTMPWCTYTDPEIAHVGLYERDARQRGHRASRPSCVPFERRRPRRRRRRGGRLRQDPRQEGRRRDPRRDHRRAPRRRDDQRAHARDGRQGRPRHASPA